MNVASEALSAETKHVYTFHPEKKLSATITQMATVEVISLKSHKVIGTFSWGRTPDQEQVDFMVGELIREYEIRKIWSRK